MRLRQRGEHKKTRPILGMVETVATIDTKAPKQDGSCLEGHMALMDSKKKIISAQQNLRAQMNAADLLAADFLTFMWSEKGTDYSALKARFERHCSALDAAGHLLPQVVLHLFAKLEERAIYEINAATALAQTIDPDSIARQRPNLPPELISNVHAVHKHVTKTAQSELARKAAEIKQKPFRDIKDAALNEWDESGSEYESKSDFARIVGALKGIKFRTLLKWIAEHEKSKQ